MEGAVGFLADETDGSFLLHTSVDFLNLRAALRIQVQGRLAGNIRFQHHAGADDVLRLHIMRKILASVFLFPDVNSAALHRIHHAVQLQRAERLAHGNTAHIKDLTELLFAGKLFSDRIAPGSNCFP